jgi:branched-chain amino acid transport system substrate-binding protein
MHVLLAFALHLRWKNHHCAGDTIMFLSVPRIACALAFITVLAGPAMPTARAADPILIGFSAPLTGDAAGSGQESLNGAKLAVEQINAKGGVLGRPLQLVQGDDRCDPKDAAIVAQKFVAQKVAAAASHYCSGAALAAIPIFRDAGTLYVDWGAVSSKIPGSGYDRLFITIYNGAQPGVYAADIAVKKLGMKKLAVVDDRTPADAEFAAAFQKHAKELGAEIVLSGHITQGDKDFSAFVTQVKGSGAQMLFTGNYYAEAGLLNRQLRDQQVSAVTICPDTCMDPQFLAIAGAAAEGAYSVTQPQADELPAAKDFVAAYQKEFGKPPGYIGPYSYDAINVIAAAYAAVGKVDNEAAAKYLHGLTQETALQGITGPLNWKTDGTLPSFTFSVYRVKDGKMQFVGH